MKVSKVFIAYLILLHLLAGYALFYSDLIKRPIPVETPAPTPVPKVSSYESAKELLIEVDQHAPNKEIAFLGDSLTQPLPVMLVSPNAVNFGIPGDTSKELANRIKDYKSLPKAKAIILEIGTNDIFLHEYNFTELIAKLPSGPAIYWYAVPPVDMNLVKKFNNQQVNQMNEGLKNLCQAMPNCTFVDITDRYKDATGNLRADYHVGDGIHLNAAAYKIWINDLKSRNL